jgi:hypothetical protein
MENRDVSEFNGAQLKLYRIDQILKGIIECRHTLDLLNWLYYLQDFDMELESVKKEDEKQELDIELKAVAEMINGYTSLRINKRRRKQLIPVEIIDRLNLYQKRILTIYKQSGLEMKLQSDAISGFGR